MRGTCGNGLIRFSVISAVRRAGLKAVRFSAYSAVESRGDPVRNSALTLNMCQQSARGWSQFGSFR